MIRKSWGNKGSVTIPVLYIMIILAAIAITTSSIIYNNYLIFHNDARYQEAYYLAESGLNCAYNDLVETAYEVHRELVQEYQWDPLKSPTTSVQEGLRQHINNYMGPRLRSRLIDKGVLSRNYSNEYLTDTMANVGTIKISMELESRYNNPLKFTITSIGTVKNSSIKRRIDAEVHIYKVSLLYDSKLFDYPVVSDKPLLVLDSGYLNIDGDVYLSQGITVNNNSTLIVNGEVHSFGPMEVKEGSFADIEGDAIFDSVKVDGENSIFNCNNDLYTFRWVAVTGANNSAYIDGALHIICEPTASGDRAGGVIAKDHGTVTLGREFFINGCLEYEHKGIPLFGLEGLINQGEAFLSGESIGGGNQSFYFFDEPNSFINTYFNESYITKTSNEKAVILKNYFNAAPDEKNREAYDNHMFRFYNKGIIIDQDSFSRSYARGAILASDKVDIRNSTNVFRDKTPKGTADSFFENVELYMLGKASWDFKHQYDTGASVPLKNAAIIDSRIYPIDNDEPLIVIDPGGNDVILPSGNYKGIIVTGGTVKVEKGDNVSFEGLIIAEEGISVSGSLTVIGNKGLLMQLIKNEDESLMNFFKINREQEFIQVISTHERNVR